MITRIQLSNFQNHRSLDLTLGKFSVLSGPSNSGKTACLRAIAALLRNDPPGEYVTLGQTNLTVTLTLQDGHVVKWEKGLKGLNRYTLTRPDGTEWVGNKVGVKVPEEILDVLRIGPITLEDGKKVHLNLHEQQESPFLIMDTAGQVAKVFGELTSAGKLFSAANEGNRRTREEKKLRTLRESDIAAAKASLAQYSNLDEQKEGLAWVEEQVKQASILTSAIETLESLIGAYGLTESDLTVAADSISRLSPVEGIDLTMILKLNEAAATLVGLGSEESRLGVQLETLDASLQKLEKVSDVDLNLLVEVDRVVRQVSSLVSEVEVAERQLQALPSQDRLTLELDLAPLSALNEAIVAVSDLLALASDARKQLLQLEGVISANEREVAEVEEFLGEIDTCPTCLQPVTAEHLLGAAHGG